MGSWSWLPDRRRLLVSLVLLAAAGGAVALWGEAAWRAWLRSRLEVAVEAHDWDEARRLVDRLMTGRPPDADLLFRKGRIMRRQGWLLEADQLLLAAQSLGYDPVTVRQQRLLAEAQCGDILDVEGEVLKLVNSGVDDQLAEECYEAITQGYVNSYRAEEAARTIDFWLKWTPENSLAHYWQGKVHEMAEKWADALVRYRRALEIEPRSYAALLAVARMEAETAAVDDASRNFRECLRRQPEDGMAMLGLATCGLKVGQEGEARELLYDALALDIKPTDQAKVVVELAQLALEDGAAQRSEALAALAVARDPQSTRCRLVHAGALARLGRAEEAAAEQTTARELSEMEVRLTDIGRKSLVNPENADLRADAGELLMGRGLELEGARWYEIALQIDPRHERSRRALAAFEERRGDLKRAAMHRSFLPADGPAGSEPTPPAEAP